MSFNDPFDYFFDLTVLMQALLGNSLASRRGRPAMASVKVRDTARGALVGLHKIIVSK